MLRDLSERMRELEPHARVSAIEAKAKQKERIDKNALRDFKEL